MLLGNYKTDNFFDEMFEEGGAVRPHYQKIAERLQALDTAEHRRKQSLEDGYGSLKRVRLLEQGDAFGGDGVADNDFHNNKKIRAEF